MKYRKHNLKSRAKKKTKQQQQKKMSVSEIWQTKLSTLSSKWTELVTQELIAHFWE